MSTIPQSNISLLAATKEMERQLYITAKKLREKPNETSQAFIDLFFAINEFNRAYQGMPNNEG